MMRYYNQNITDSLKLSIRRLQTTFLTSLHDALILLITIANYKRTKSIFQSRYSIGSRGVFVYISLLEHYLIFFFFYMSRVSRKVWVTLSDQVQFFCMGLQRLSVGCPRCKNDKIGVSLIPIIFGTHVLLKTKYLDCMAITNIFVA